MNRIKQIIKEEIILLEYDYKIADKEEFDDLLHDLTTLDLEDDQVIYPKNINDRKQKYLFGGNDYNLLILDRPSLPSAGPFEVVIVNDDDLIIGFIRGTKRDNIISINLIHIKEEHRGRGIGTDIYETLLNDGYIIRSDDEITDATYSIYSGLLYYNYIPIIFNDGRAGLKK